MNINCSISSMPGVGALRGITLEVPDLEAAAPFFAALGVTVTGDGTQCSVHTVAQADCMTLRPVPGRRRRLRRITFTAPPSEIGTIHTRAIEAGHMVIAATPASLLMSGPDGIESEVVARDVPQVKAYDSQALIFPHAPCHSEIDTPRPQSLCHAAIFVSAMPEALDFYCRVLGLRVSDRCGGDLVFLHSRHGGDHHILALVKSSGPGLHHYSFEMGTIDAIGLRAAHLARQGYEAGWGMGRHVLGSNFFHYVRDPWDCHVELTAGLDQIASDSDRAPGDHKAQDAFYLWGPPPPLEFIANPEALPVGQPLVTA
ncbi:VOC family protein [Novosphingobium panipatense]|uniref:VOC family protein n=1 Tax=Novosphingobium panipatense TaxID=428991 RepID=UPI0039A2B353